MMKITTTENGNGEVGGEEIIIGMVVGMIKVALGKVIGKTVGIVGLGGQIPNGVDGNGITNGLVNGRNRGAPKSPTTREPLVIIGLLCMAPTSRCPSRRCLPKR